MTPVLVTASPRPIPVALILLLQMTVGGEPRLTQTVVSRPWVNPGMTLPGFRQTPSRMTLQLYSLLVSK